MYIAHALLSADLFNFWRQFYGVVAAAWIGNGFLANQSKPCHTRCQNFTILGKLDMFRKTIETAPSWMFFHSTTAACFKEVGDKVWFFRKDCSRENIFNFSLSNEG